MGHRHQIIKENIRRKEYEKKELYILSYKYSIADSYNGKLLKYFINYKYQNKFKLLFSMARAVNRCVLTGRSRWVLRRFKMCRFKFRLNAENDKINGIRYSKR